MLLNHFTTLLLGLCAVSAVGSSPVQQSFDAHSGQPGILRRFLQYDHNLDNVLQIAQANDLDIWQVTPSHIDIFSPPFAPSLPIELQQIPHSKSEIPSSPPPKNTQPLAEKLSDWSLNSLQNTTFHETYHPLYEIEAFIQQMVAMYPDYARLNRVGLTAQGREMYSLTISSQELSETRKRRKKKDHSKSAFVIMGAQHAREWVATATSLYVAHALLVNSTEPHALSPLLRNFEFHIIPVPNPDGYDYTWESDRFWYKNRQSVDPNSGCVGIDMNRNWGYKWKSEPTGLFKDEQESENRTTDPMAHLSDPCSHWYPGREPFEAPEVNNIANFISSLPNLEGFIDLRSYGQMLSLPFSYSCTRLPNDAEDQMEAAFGATSALKAVHGTQFKTGSLCSNLYRAPGNILDWVYARARAKYSYVVHLRDTGTYGFSLPQKWIRPVGEETSKLIQYIAKFSDERRWF